MAKDISIKAVLVLKPGAFLQDLPALVAKGQVTLEVATPAGPGDPAVLTVAKKVANKV